MFQRAFYFTTTIPVAGSYNLLTAIQATGQWDGVSPIIATITCTGNQGATNTSTPAFDTGTLPVGSTLTLTINSGCGIYGAGGNGGYGGLLAQYTSTYLSTAGSPGGPALNLQCPTVIINNGAIAGGGGGGGGGQGAGPMHWNGNSHNGEISPGASGGGGAGFPAGFGGACWRNQAGYLGKSGTLTTGGAGGVVVSQSGSGDIEEWWGAAAGGAGSGLGQSGITPPNNTNGNASPAGGAGGSAVIGSSNVTWQVYGSVLGSLS